MLHALRQVALMEVDGLVESYIYSTIPQCEAPQTVCRSLHNNNIGGITFVLVGESPVQSDHNK